MTLNILNTLGDKFSKKAGKILNGLGNVDYFNLTRKDVLASEKLYDVIVVGLYPIIDREVIDKHKGLKIIASVTTNLDHIDVEYAKSKGIKVMCLYGENDLLNKITGTAELAFGLMLDLLRHTPWAFEDVKNYNWEREKFRGNNLYGKVVGIFGLGRLGRMMARYCKAFDMQVIVCDPYVDDSVFNELGCKRVDFETLLEKSDIISIHVYLTKETEHIFDQRAFSKIKKGVFIINTSVRTIVDDEDVLRALEKKQIAGYATDVLEKELVFGEGFKEHPLVEYAKNNKNLIIVPHIGGMTYESREATDIFIAEKLKKFLKYE